VAKAYEREGLLATEHALLDDNGDKDGSQDPAATGKDGKVANIVSGSARQRGGAAELSQGARPPTRTARSRTRVEALRLLKDIMDRGAILGLEKMVPRSR
jgi:hypothetical protein